MSGRHGPISNPGEGPYLDAIYSVTSQVLQYYTVVSWRQCQCLYRKAFHTLVPHSHCLVPHLEAEQKSVNELLRNRLP